MTKTLVDEYAELSRSTSDKQKKLELTLDEIRSITERRDMLREDMEAAHASHRSSLQDQVTKCVDKLRHLHMEAIDQRHAVRLAQIKVECVRMRIEFDLDA